MNAQYQFAFDIFGSLEIRRQTTEGSRVHAHSAVACTLA